ncbi:MAG: geranylgeranylglyceryl/heptaprenylglyceryl phosphate synthase [Bacteroidia bacterium]|nr:geranylgeranylglyceryl/heptaprenylglyceryl phosphate synthase [Bacteroidia bacterium]
MPQTGTIYEKLRTRPADAARLVLLLDPDKISPERAARLAFLLEKNGGAALLLGSSMLLQETLGLFISALKKACSLPVLIFPGSGLQLHAAADGLMLLSLVSGRNADLLIGKHVEAAPWLHKSGLEILSTAYILVDGGRLTSVQYMSQTLPVPAAKNDLAVATALASEMLGLKQVYLEAGSGALNPVPPTMIRAVKEYIQVPLWVGGGIRTPQQCAAAVQAGADLVVIGNVMEEEEDAHLEAMCRASVKNNA